MDENREKYIGFSTRYSEITGRMGTGTVIFKKSRSIVIEREKYL